MKKAFTLIELLVVVLIIGILAAIALPQYQKAVNKSKAATYWPVLKNLSEASQVCALSKGAACGLEELDIEAPVCKPWTSDVSCSYEIEFFDGIGNAKIQFTGYHKDYALLNIKGIMLCEGTDFCKSIGYTFPATACGETGFYASTSGVAAQCLE